MKSEINLEISTGFFRISTEDVVYNITVLDSCETGAAKVVKTILAEERSEPQELPSPQAGMEEVDLAAQEVSPGDDYYKQVSSDLYHDIGSLAKSLSATIMDIPVEDRRSKRAELDEAGEKIEDAKKQLQDIVSMTEKATMEIMDQVEKVQGQTEGVKDLLSLLRNHNAFQGGEDLEDVEASGSGAGEKLQELQAKIAQANELVSTLKESEPAQQAEAAVEEEPEDIPEVAEATEKKKRYLFEIDTIFQTIYELCTNEPVKGHITSARENAAEIFNTDEFIDTFGERIKDLEPDSDNFFTVPLTDVLESLNGSCSDGKIQNLLKKMDLNQGDIFLDQSLPLEVPPIEEIEVAAPSDDNPEPAEEVVAEETGAATSSAAVDVEKVEELAAMMAESESLASELEQEIEQVQNSANGGMGAMSRADQQDIFQKIEDAFQVTTTITDDVTRITEALSFQDLSGQQILKIIKLLSDFQVQLLAIVVSFGSQLKSKEKNATISHEDGKKLAQEEVDKYLKNIGLPKGDEEVGTLDQDAVNSMLEDFGF
jgi:chemotaxis regulatin CheY-phosphate phosphatase CheZ